MRVVPYLLCLAVAGCFAGGAPEPEAPELAPGKKCRVTKSKARPLIVEWSSPDRADLEARIQGGVVAVRYDGCDLEVLTGCIVEGAGCDYTAVTRKFDRVSISNEDELYASLPVGAASLSARLATAGRLTVDMIMVGAYRADVVAVDVGQIRGACSQATHFVAGLTAGAFEFYTGAGAEVGADASGFGLRGGGKSSSEQESLSRDGKPDQCQSTPGSPAPPRGCSALLRVQVTPITGGVGPDEPAVAPPLPKSSGPADAPGTWRSAPGPHPVQRPVDDLLLHLWRQIVEIGGVTGHAHEQAGIAARVVPGLPKDLRVEHVHLHLHAACLEGAADQALEGRRPLLIGEGPGRELEVEVDAVFGDVHGQGGLGQERGGGPLLARGRRGGDP